MLCRGMIGLRWPEQCNHRRMYGELGGQGVDGDHGMRELCKGEQGNDLLEFGGTRGGYASR